MNVLPYWFIPLLLPLHLVRTSNSEKRLKSDAGIFLYQKKGMNIVVAVIYVDDTLFCGPTKAIVDEIKGLFMKKWECRDLGQHDGHKILIDQCSYLEKVFEHFGM